MEQALKEIPFPGPEIDMHPADYARLVCSMVDIPCHKLENNKSVIESLHMLFTFFSQSSGKTSTSNRTNRKLMGLQTFEYLYMSGRGA